MGHRYFWHRSGAKYQLLVKLKMMSVGQEPGVEPADDIYALGMWELFWSLVIKPIFLTLNFTVNGIIKVKIHRILNVFQSSW